MENIPNTNPIPTPSPQTEVKEPKKGVSKKVLILVIVVLFILLLATGAILLYQNGYMDTLLGKEQQKKEEVQETKTEEEENTEVTEEPQENTFNGDTVKATLPEGWTVVEHYNGEGTESLPKDETYIGLTGLQILNQDREVFAVQAVSGIGFVGCPEYTKFADYNPNHLALNQSMAEEMGDTMNITDYSDTEYIQFDWLGKTFRRIDKIYFYDEEEGNNYFEVGCVNGLLVMEGFNFTDSTGYMGEAYFYGATETATEADLLVVDEILESMELQ